MAEVCIADDASSAEIVLAPGERLASSSLANVLLARAGVRAGLDHAALASLPDVVGPARVRVASATAGRTVLGRDLPVARPGATVPGDLTAADGLLQVAGDVHVLGDVTVHAAIAALGDVRIDGDLAGGRVAAGGHVTVGGMIRRESVVEAGGGIRAAGVEAATLRTAGLVEVTGPIERSAVEADAIRVEGPIVGGEVVVFGELRYVEAGPDRPAIVRARRPRPRAVEAHREARRAEMEGQLARLRQVQGAASADAPTRAKVEAAIASLEGRLQGL